MGSGMNDDSQLLIPRIIHQTWKSADLQSCTDPVFRDYALRSQVSWKQFHPDFEYMFWTDEDMERFVSTHYKWFYPTWKQFDVHIKRIDTARYCWLHYFGGMYCDLDMICIKNVEPTLVGQQMVSYKTTLSMKNSLIFAGNAWMASVKEHPIWIEMLNYTKNHLYQKTEKGIDVRQHTGPLALGVVVAAHIQRNPGCKVKVLEPDLIGNEDEPPYEYAFHGRTHSW